MVDEPLVVSELSVLHQVALHLEVGCVPQESMFSQGVDQRHPEVEA